MSSSQFRKISCFLAELYLPRKNLSFGDNLCYYTYDFENAAFHNTLKRFCNKFVDLVVSAASITLANVFEAHVYITCKSILRGTGTKLLKTVLQLLKIHRLVILLLKKTNLLKHSPINEKFIFHSLFYVFRDKTSSEQKALKHLKLSFAAHTQLFEKLKHFYLVYIFSSHQNNKYTLCTFLHCFLVLNWWTLQFSNIFKALQSGKHYSI